MFVFPLFGDQKSNVAQEFQKGRKGVRPLALQSELNKDSISKFVKFRLQSMSFKIERAFEITTKFSIKIMLKRA